MPRSQWTWAIADQQFVLSSC